MSIQDEHHTAASTSTEDKKAWQLLEKTVDNITKEQKASRRWGIVFKSLTFLYLFSFIFILLAQEWPAKTKAEKHVAIVKVQGVIAESEVANANAIAASLRKAFEAENSEAVMIVINSPGGSPVQSGYIYNEINRLEALHPEKKTYAVIGDLGASGGYYVAAAADEIYAHESSLVGSIGVTAAGFGFVDLMEKLGVERRAYTSGEHKAFLDPFSPSKPDEVEFWKGVLDKTHEQFIQAVTDGRGDRLADDPQLYSGLIWNGEQAKGLGLIDGFGSPGQVARDVIGVEEVVDYTYRPDVVSQLLKDFGISIGEGITQSLQRHTVELR